MHNLNSSRVLKAHQIPVHDLYFSSSANVWATADVGNPSNHIVRIHGHSRARQVLREYSRIVYSPLRKKLNVMRNRCRMKIRKEKSMPCEMAE